MKIKNKILTLMTSLSLSLCLCQTAFASPVYEITFRAGNHGTIYGENKLVVERGFEEAFPNEPDVEPEEGYMFVGWNEAFPETVEGKETYVAKYRKIISGQELKIRYLDQNGVDIITPRVRIVKNGSTVEVTAFDINGWPVDEKVKTITISEGENEITFVYTVPADVIQFEYEYNEIIQYVDRVVNISTVTPPTDETTEIGDTQTPLGENEPGATDEDTPTVDIDDEDTPLASGVDQQSKMPTQMYLMGGLALLVGAGIVVLLVLKKRKSEQ